jgi:hypothetical protein
MNATHDSPIPASLHAVLALFEGPLQGVRFPDVDAASLTQLAADVAHGVAAVRDAEQALIAARRAHDERLEALTAKAQRALAYARVFAEGDAELSAQLADLARRNGPRDRPLVEAAAPAAPRRRGRPRKVVPPEPERALPAGDPTPAE